MNENIVLVAQDESKNPPSMKSVGTGGMMSARVGADRARYDLFLTNRRIIAAVVFSQSDMSRWGPAAQFQTIGASMKWKKIKEEMRTKFAGKTPDEILQLHPESLQFPYDYIQSVEVEKKMVGGKIVLQMNTTAGVQRFEIPAPKSRLTEIENTLKLYIPGRVR